MSLSASYLARSISGSLVGNNQKAAEVTIYF